MKQVVIVRCMLAAFVCLANPAVAQRTVADGPRSSASTADNLLQRPVTFRVNNVALRAAIDLLAAQTKVAIGYRQEWLDAAGRSVTIDATRQPLGDILAQMLSGTKFHVIVMSSDAIALKLPTAGESTDEVGTILGVVTDANTKQPLRGVTVILDDSVKSERTNEVGRYRFVNVPAGSHRVSARAIGFARQTTLIAVTGNQSTTANFSLEGSVNQLGQVVVTGTVIPTQLKAVPNAITIITAKEIEQRGITHIDQLFRGDVPGLFAINTGSGSPASGNGGTPNAFHQVTMFSRGATTLADQGGTSYSPGTLYGTNPIKTYVDGVELADPSYLSQIDPQSIERIEILAGPQASTIYGSNALNGVMQIFTKRGTHATPHVSLELKSGVTQNNFNSSMAPQHNGTVQVDGIEGHLAYNGGGSVDVTGSWTPGIRTTTLDAFGGVRYENGPVTIDVNLRRTNGQNRQTGSTFQVSTDRVQRGLSAPVAYIGGAAPTLSTYDGETMGLTLGYTPLSWWSNQLILGSDVSSTEGRTTAPGYLFSAADTTLSLTQGEDRKVSLAYHTTVQLPIASFAQLTMTGGGDGWHSLTTSLSASTTTLTGTFNDPCQVDGSSCTSLSRQVSHNAGGFVQGQLALYDALFVTYGLRAEWNPDYGKEQEPNLAPRVGVAYTQTFGNLTTKLRGSYGQSTRPPFHGAIDGELVTYQPYNEIWGAKLYGTLPNPDLGPEHQQGFEAGLDLFWGSYASLSVTHSNQTVSDLIALVTVDSARSLVQDPGGYCTDNPTDCGSDSYRYFEQPQFANVANIRNQSWEFQGTFDVGPWTATGTYSWVKSRSLGMTPKFLAQFPASQFPQYQPGATPTFLAEHTWASGLSYARGSRTIRLNVTGNGQIYSQSSEAYLQYITARLLADRALASNTSRFVSLNGGYIIADLNVTQRFSSHLEGLLQIHNLANTYRNDFLATLASPGRQTQVGLRIR